MEHEIVLEYLRHKDHTTDLTANKNEALCNLLIKLFYSKLRKFRKNRLRYVLKKFTFLQKGIMPFLLITLSSSVSSLKSKGYKCYIDKKWVDCVPGGK